jgi:sterol 3beta-glucosyltransferase
MHIGLFTYGSRGDVQPYIALALRLTEEGYNVTLAAPENFKDFVESFNISFYPVVGNAEDIVHSPECEKIIKSGNNLAFIKFLFNSLSHRRSELFESILGFCKLVDAIVANNIGATTVSVAAEKLNLKMIILQLNPPVIETNTFPVPGMPFPNLAWLNKLSYKLFYRIMWHFAKSDINEFRQRIGLPLSKHSVIKIIADARVPVIHAFSEELIKRPLDWKEHHLVTGFLILDGVKRSENNFDNTSAQLNKWLAEGSKPVYIGFGSIPVPDPLRLMQAITHLLNSTQERVLLCTGWSKMPDMPQHPNLFTVSSANHQWLFPKCKIVVIHGGIGTLTAALTAGVPSIVVSLFVDQPIWGQLISKKGVGIHLPWRKMTPKSLVKAIKHLNNDAEIANNAVLLSKKLSAEDGAGAAVRYIRHYFETVVN